MEGKTMKKPNEVENEVMEKYFPIAEQRAKKYLMELDKTIEENKEEYYLSRRICLGDKLEYDVEENKLPQEDMSKEKKNIAKRVISIMIEKYIRVELAKMKWKITCERGIYYLKKVEED